ncbi:hypothetical protein FSARC_10770 [Fusarium sarcochroum]|uniref:SnoaL-like domain-containing protein n=1 Tax=Fusarium sarcochroum TaxID=1208366 RepID=A0A8H4X321_9HYPO|nr:hypothetical protein FSARC_10770 [Fusarium sarcochroum]
MSSSTQDDRKTIEAWLLAFHDASKSLDADAWLDNFFTDNAALQYGNSPVISGLAVRLMFKNVFSKLDMMTHDVEYFDYVPPRIYQAATIRYLVKGDDPEKDVIQIPGFATFFVRKGDDGEIRCYRAETFLDPSPVFQRMVEKGE